MNTVHPRRDDHAHEHALHRKRQTHVRVVEQDRGEEDRLPQPQRPRIDSDDDHLHGSNRNREQQLAEVKAQRGRGLEVAIGVMDDALPNKRGLWCAAATEWRDGCHRSSCAGALAEMLVAPTLSRRSAMHPPTQQTTNIPTRRILAGSGVLLFVGMFFALPLFAALTLCTMPCCDHDNGTNGPVVSADMTPCATECAIRTDEATATQAPSIAPGKPAAKRAVVVSVVVAAMDTPPVTAPGDRGVVAGSRADAPVHVLNSVFRI